MKILLACFPLIVLPLFADEFLEAEYGGSDPNHLEPVDAHSSAYRENLAKCLLVTSSELGLMITLPSFEPESAVAIYGTGATTTSLPSLDPDPKPEDIPEDKFFVTSTKAKQRIPGTVIPDDAKIEVVRHDLQISKQLAVAIQRAWARMLLRTKYPETSYAGLDGERYEFGLFVRGIGDLKGEIWSPSKGLPAEIVALGKKLETFAEAEKPLSVEGEAELIKELKAFEARAKEP